MGNTTNLTTEKAQFGNDVRTITTLEISEMMEISHRDVLNKLQGTYDKDGNAKQIGIIPTLAQANFRLSDYFTESSYKDASGKTNICYNVTKLGCDFLANKFTGEKGIIFTARYVKRFNEMEQALIPKDYPSALRAYADEYEKRMIAENENKLLSEDNERMKPKADFFDAVADSKDAIEIGKVAKVLNYPGVGRNKLFDILRKQNVLMRDNIPYQKYIDNGCFRTIEQKYMLPNGETRISIKTLVYQKGVEHIRKVLERSA